MGERGRVMYFWGVVIILLTLALLGVACQPVPADVPTESAETQAPAQTSDESSESAVKDTLIIAIPGLPNCVDVEFCVGPQFVSMEGQWNVKGLEYNQIPYPYPAVDFADPNQIPGFTYPDIDLDNLEPGVLESCELSDDGLTATYHIRPGVMSFWGNELTSDDVMWGVEKAHSLDATSLFFMGVANADQPGQWRAVDKYTVEITSETPMAMICKMNILTDWGNFFYSDSTELQNHVTEDDPWASEWLETHTAGFGPYQITSWEPGKQIVMEANPNFWEGPLPIKKIIWLVVPESSSRVALLKAGEVDIVEGLAPEEIESLSGEPGVVAAAVRSNSEFLIVMSNNIEPFDNAQVRQAMNHAIPREEIITLYKGLAEEWQGVLPLVFPGYFDRHEYDYDLEKARQLLEEAGYADGFEVPISYNAGDPIQEQVAIAIQTSLREIGVEATLQKLPPAALTDLVESHTAEFAFWVDAPFLPDPNFDDMIWYKSGFLANWWDYENPEVDRLLEECKLVVDWDERIACHKQLEDIVYADSPHGWVLSPDFLIAMRDNIEGWNWDPGMTYRIKDISFTEE
jgi:peptide/nickel transport system substrate-binding protein